MRSIGVVIWSRFAHAGVAVQDGDFAEWDAFFPEPGDFACFDLGEEEAWRVFVGDRCWG